MKMLHIATATVLIAALAASSVYIVMSREIDQRVSAERKKSTYLRDQGQYWENLYMRHNEVSDEEKEKAFGGGLDIADKHGIEIHTRTDLKSHLFYFDHPNGRNKYEKPLAGQSPVIMKDEPYRKLGEY